jgi:hypothetical protein
LLEKCRKRGGRGRGRGLKPGGFKAEGSRSLTEPSLRGCEAIRGLCKMHPTQRRVYVQLTWPTVKSDTCRSSSIRSPLLRHNSWALPPSTERSLRGKTLLHSARCQMRATRRTTRCRWSCGNATSSSASDVISGVILVTCIMVCVSGIRGIASACVGRCVCGRRANHV